MGQQLARNGGRALEALKGFEIGDWKFEMDQTVEKFDLIVIGGGRASTLAIAAANAGKTVALIERDRLGGTCPNRGCVPSKLLIGYAETARRIREADRHFIDVSLNSMDLEKVFQEVSSYVGAVDARYESRMPEGLELIRGHGYFISDKVVGIEGSERQLTANTIVIGAGTRSRPSPYPGLPVWTSDDLFPFSGKVPKSLAVIGGGFIGTELGNFFSAVGVETTLYVRGNDLLPKVDGEIGEIFKTQFTHHTPVEFNSSLKDLSHDGQQFHLTFARDDAEYTVSVEQVLFATGRVSNADLLKLENTRIVTDSRGFIETNDCLETAVGGVYAAGDIAGKYILQHAATWDIQYLRQRLLKGVDGPLVYGQMPAAIYSDPEIASVGATEEELIASGTPYKSVVRDWQSSARAMASRLDFPRVKVMVNPEDFSILGCHLIGPDASTLIHEILMLMHLKNDIREILNMIHIHPALSEIFMGVAVGAIKD